MNVTFPAYLLPNEITRKQFWLGAYTAALGRLAAHAAVAEADLALELCDASGKMPPQSAHGSFATTTRSASTFLSLPSRVKPLGALRPPRELAHQVHVPACLHAYLGNS